MPRLVACCHPHHLPLNRRRRPGGRHRPRVPRDQATDALVDMNPNHTEPERGADESADDPTGRTSRPGVWAAGSATNPRAQVMTAAGEGSAAAIALDNGLFEGDARLAFD